MGMDLPKVKTPCIGVCSTGIGDSVCRGCKRFAHEVIHWNAYSEEQKRVVDQRLAGFLSKCVANVLSINDTSLVKWQLDVQQIRYNENHDENCWLFALLKAGAGQIGVTQDFGFRVKYEYRHLNLFEIRDKIDSEFYILSSAYYDRYVAIPDLFDSVTGTEN